MKTQSTIARFAGLTALLFSISLGNAQPSVSVGLARGFPEQTSTVPVGVRRATNLVAAQFDLTYNPVKGTLHSPTLATRHTGHVIRSREISPGVRRVLVYSRTNAILNTNGFTATLGFDVPSGERVGSGPIGLANVILARTNSLAIAPVTTSSGRVFVAPVFRDPTTGLVDLFLPSEPERTYFVQATEDFSRWVTISTNVATGAFLDLVDEDAPNYPHRFYRPIPLDPGR